MFGGIVQEIGQITSVSGQGVITISVVFQRAVECTIGDSVAINGVCLTVTELDAKERVGVFEVVPETLRKTTLESLEIGHFVNIELSLRLTDFVGGHMVQGHVDGVGIIQKIEHESYAWLVEISAPEHILESLVDKGFVTIDGMSITVIEVRPTYFTVTFIPHTIESTLVKTYQVGTKINLESDPIVKHIHRYMERIKHVASS